MWPAARTGLKTWQIHYIYKDSPQYEFLGESWRHTGLLRSVFIFSISVQFLVCINYLIMPKVWISGEKNYTTLITCTSLLSNINPFMFHRFELRVKVLPCTLYLCSFSERRVIWGLVHLEPGESPCPHISMTPLQYGLLLSNASNSRWNFFHPQCICKVRSSLCPTLCL